MYANKMLIWVLTPNNIDQVYTSVKGATVLQLPESNSQSPTIVRGVPHSIIDYAGSIQF